MTLHRKQPKAKDFQFKTELTILVSRSSQSMKRMIKVRRDGGTCAGLIEQHDRFLDQESRPIEQMLRRIGYRQRITHDTPRWILSPIPAVAKVSCRLKPCFKHSN